MLKDGYFTSNKSRINRPLKTRPSPIDTNNIWKAVLGEPPKIVAIFTATFIWSIPPIQIFYKEIQITQEICKIIENIFGDIPETHIVDFLLRNLPYDFPITEIAKYTKLSRTSIYSKLEKLKRFGLIEESRSFKKWGFLDSQEMILLSLVI